MFRPGWETYRLLKFTQDGAQPVRGRSTLFLAAEGDSAHRTRSAHNEEIIYQRFFVVARFRIVLLNSFFSDQGVATSFASENTRIVIPIVTIFLLERSDRNPAFV
jgi:hypothetical protein